LQIANWQFAVVNSRHSPPTTMSTPSDALLLTWHVAALEAGAAGHATIKPGHVFVALCKLTDMPL